MPVSASGPPPPKPAQPLSRPRIHPVQWPGPIQDPLVRRHQSMPFQRRGHDDPVSGIAMHVLKQPGSDCNPTVGRNLNQAGVQQAQTPGLHVPQQRHTPFTVQHRDFPEREGGYRRFFFSPGLINGLPGFRAES